MSTIGLPELIVIGMILMLVFGASRLPKIAEGLGRAIGNLKRGLREDARIEVGPGQQPGQPTGPQSAGTPTPITPSSSTASDARSSKNHEAVDAEILDETKR